MKQVTLNCDLGEGSLNDEAIIPLVDAVNIACGFHAGDPHLIHQTIQLAKKHHVQIGAHPSFQDLEGFGRRNMNLTPDQIYDIVVYQLGAINGFIKVQQTKLHHVKPHGALYNLACKDRKMAEAISQAVFDVDPSLKLVGLPNSELIHAGQEKGLEVLNEVFADRTYQPDGTLTPRSEVNSVLSNTKEVIKQVESMISRSEVTATNGEIIEVKADTICVHGDNAEALALVNSIRHYLLG